LQERAALSHGAAHLVWPGSRVLGDALLVGLIGLPVDVASMMLLDQHLPFLARQLPNALLAHAGRVERHLRARLAIDIGPGIDRVRQNLVDSVIARVHPADVGMGVHLQRQLEAPIAEPQPHAASGTHLGKTVEDGADCGDDGLVGMEQHLAVRVAPDEACRQATPQLSALSLVADAAVETGSEHMQLGLAHGALEPEQQTVVEQRRMIDAVGIPSSCALPASAYWRSVDSRL